MSEDSSAWALRGRGDSPDSAPAAGRPTLARSVLNTLGQRIVAGTLPPGSILRIEDLQAEFDVSRTVVRDVLRSLESMNLVHSRRSIGATVRDSQQWNSFSPDVVQWRLEHDPRHQMRALVALRLAVEPVAASLTAATSPSIGDRLLLASDAMHEAADAGDLDTFLVHDLDFHRMILRHCGNEMFGALESVLADVLRARHAKDLMPPRPHDVPLALHRLVAAAIKSADAVTAEWAMRQIVTEVRDVVDAPWRVAPSDH